MTIPFLLFITIFLALMLFLIYELRRSPGEMQWGKRPKWIKRFRIALTCVPILFVAILIYGFFVEPNRLIVHAETIPIQNWPQTLSGLRIAIISDVHTGGPF